VDSPALSQIARLDWITWNKGREERGEKTPPDRGPGGGKQEVCKVGRDVILSAAKNLGAITEVLACQRDPSLRSG